MPMIVDQELAGGLGFGTKFVSCLRPEYVSSYYGFIFNSSFFPARDPFMQVFVSFSNDPMDLFLDAQKTVYLKFSTVFTGCFGFSISDLQRNEFLNSHDSDKAQQKWKEQGFDHISYNHGYCLDYCIQNATLRDHGVNERLRVIFQERLRPTSQSMYIVQCTRNS